MNTLLWIVQGVLALKVLTAVYTHGLRHTKPELHRSIDRMGPPAKPVLIASSTLMLVGAVGLVGPVLPGVPAWAAPAAASGLAALQLLSIVFHLRCREAPNWFVAVVLSALAACIAVGRWGLSPL